MPKIACDVKTALLELARLGIEGRGFEHDIMLYAFLLDADPGGVALEEQARRRLDLKLGASPEQHADIALELDRILEPAIDARGLRQLYASIELPLAGVLARMERTGMRIDPRRIAAPLGADGDGDRAPHRGYPRARRAAVQHQLAAAARATFCSKI